MFGLVATCRPAARQSVLTRHIHATPSVQAIRRSKAAIREECPVESGDMEPADIPDNSSVVHMRFRQQRKYLYYMRLIEHELPQLVAFRKPFVPPAPSQPLIVRSISYGGEEHPVTRKRVIVVPVSRLPLVSSAAFHAIKLLAGPRWSHEAPKDSGIGQTEDTGKHGYIKISCEDFPEPAMNLKWASDALDRLVQEANNAKDTFADVPLDKRHLQAKARKAKKGDHVRRQRAIRPSIRDFPQEWLPTRSVDSSAASTL